MALDNAKAKCAAVCPISRSSTIEARRIVHVLNRLQKNDLISDVPVLSTHLPHIGQSLCSKEEDQSLTLVSFGRAVQVEELGGRTARPLVPHPAPLPLQVAAALRVAAQDKDKEELKRAWVLAYAWIERGAACLLDHDVALCERSTRRRGLPPDWSQWDADLELLGEEEEEAPAAAPAGGAARAAPATAAPAAAPAAAAAAPEEAASVECAV